MPRDVQGSLAGAVRAPVVRPVYFVKLTLDTGNIRLNSSDRNIVFSGQTYLGVGRMGTVSAVEDTVQLQAASIQMTLSGIPTSFLQIALAENYQGRYVRLSLGLLDDTYELVKNPVLIFVGLIDQMSVVVGKYATITLTAQNELSRWEVPRIRRYTNEDQRLRYPNDTGLRFLEQTVEREIYWGAAPATSPTSETPGGGPPAPDPTFTYDPTDGRGWGEGGSAGDSSDSGGDGGTNGGGAGAGGGD